MRAAVFPQPGECVLVERQALLPAEGQVLVRVAACGVCGTDAHIYRGHFPARFPLVAGHEFAGVIQDVGPGAKLLRAGDHVAVDPNLSCGQCRPCRRGLPHLCRNLSAIGVTQDGGFATHCLVPAPQVHKVPEDMSFPVAAMSEPVACCIHGIERAQIRPGDIVVLIGAGMIGLILLQLALMRGAAQAIVSELEAGKREIAQSLGAACVVDPKRDDLRQIVAEATEGSGADVVIECVGGEETAQQAVALVGDGGRLILFGVAAETAKVIIEPYDIYRREVTITGSFTNPFTHAAAVSLLASGRLLVSDLISHLLPLEALPEAIALLESRKATKIVIEPSESNG